MTPGLTRVGPEAFQGEQLRQGGVAIVAFLADWCPFCRSFETEFALLQGAGPWTLLVADLTLEESPLWERFRVEVVPTVLVFRDGSSVFRADGVRGEGLGKDDLARIEAAARGARHPRTTGRRGSRPVGSRPSAR